MLTVHVYEVVVIADPEAVHDAVVLQAEQERSVLRLRCYEGVIVHKPLIINRIVSVASALDKLTEASLVLLFDEFSISEELDAYLVFNREAFAGIWFDIPE